MEMKSDSSYIDFIENVKRSFGLDLSQYKQEQMLRRLRGSMQRAGTSDYREYLQLIKNDTEVRQVFLDRLTINVSELFRNPEHFRTLETRVLPVISEGKNNLRVWSAACSYGAEPVSLSILIKEKLPHIGFDIYATDVDQTILRRASTGEFREADMKNVTMERRMRWFRKKLDVYSAKPEIMQKITFAKHNLLADTSPGLFDLIVCRNVLIYFNDDAKCKVYKLLYNSLKRGGYLFIGGTERIMDHEQYGFINPMPFFYTKN